MLGLRPDHWYIESSWNEFESDLSRQTIVPDLTSKRPICFPMYLVETKEFIDSNFPSPSLRSHDQEVTGSQKVATKRKTKVSFVEWILLG